MIEWEDSRLPESNWIFLSTFTPGSTVRCVSAGWMIHDGQDMKVLAPNMGDINDEEVQISGVIRIPSRCILEITALNEISSSSGPSSHPETKQKQQVA